VVWATGLAGWGRSGSSILKKETIGCFAANDGLAVLFSCPGAGRFAVLFTEISI
jgi:hypothetical protein